jgi:hypothetical protein
MARTTHLALRLVLGVGLSAGAVASASADIVYTVDQTIGAGSVTGTITTDGATGVLSVSDILAWNLTLNGVGASYDLASTDTNANKYVIGNDLTATPTAIYFNFSGTAGDQFLLQDGPEIGNTYWCNSAGTSSCFPGKSDVPVYYGDASSQFDMTASGNQIIATAGVPEPSTWALMLAGFAGIGLAGYRRSRKALFAPARS